MPTQPDERVDRFIRGVALFRACLTASDKEMPFPGQFSTLLSNSPLRRTEILSLFFMVWVYDRTKSLLVTMLMHAPLAANQFILLPPALSGVSLVTYDLVFAAALWGVIAVVFVTKAGHLSH